MFTICGRTDQRPQNVIQVNPEFGQDLRPKLYKPIDCKSCFSVTPDCTMHYSAYDNKQQTVCIICEAYVFELLLKNKKIDKKIVYKYICHLNFIKLSCPNVASISHFFIHVYLNKFHSGSQWTISINRMILTIQYTDPGVC